MPDSIVVFLSGTIGVTSGMILLYLSIKLTALVVNRLGNKRQEAEI